MPSQIRQVGKSRTKQAPIDWTMHLMLHELLDSLEQAAQFAAVASPKIQILEERLVAMQEIAEEVAQAPGSAEDREIACAKIDLFAQQLDVIARKPRFQDRPILEGGTFHFALPKALEGLPEALEVELPNLRARGPGSLEMFEHVEGMFAYLSDGRVKAAYELEAAEASTDENEDEAALETETTPQLLPEGRYILEITVLQPDGTDAQFRLLPAEGGAPLCVQHIDLSADDEALEIDSGFGLGFLVDQLAKSDEVSVGTQFIQTLEWKHESGERLESIEGWFHETTQPRDFDLYALYLETPLQTVRRASDALTSFMNETTTLLEQVMDQMGNQEDPATLIEEGLVREGAGWRAVESDALLKFLMLEESANA